MPYEITRISDWSNELSDRIENAAPAIATVIPRKPLTSSERYIIFTENGKPLPDEALDVIQDIQDDADKRFEIKALSGHDDPERDDEEYPVAAMTYETDGIEGRATYMLTA